VWPFAHEIKKGDLVVLPLKTQPASQTGEMTSDCCFRQWQTSLWLAPSRGPA
jgi:predicted Mrr-cat superfamily restriction endonuclease